MRALPTNEPGGGVKTNSSNLGMALGGGERRCLDALPGYYMAAADAIGVARPEKGGRELRV